MDAITFTAFTNALAVMGNAALIIITPIMVWNSYKMIKMDIILNLHLKQDAEVHNNLRGRLEKHGTQIDDIFRRIGAL